MERRQGCLGGLFELFLLGWLFDWLEHSFGFGRGCSCSGCGCGCLLLLVFIYLFFQIVFGTNWFRPLLTPIFGL